MRAKVDDLLTQFDERTAQLRAAQQAAAALTANLTSEDRLVRVTIDATGMLTELTIDPDAFDRTTPDALARTISGLVRRGTAQVRQQAADLMRPLTEGLPDLSDLSPGAPSLADMLPKIPDFSAPVDEPDPGSIMTSAPSVPPPPPPPPKPHQHVRPDFDDDQPSSWMRDDDD